MRGLLKKDFYGVIMNNLAPYATIVLIFTFNAMVIHNAIMLFAIGPILVLTFAIGRFNFDRMEGWTALSSFLPVSAKKTVLARYLFVFISAILSTLIMPLLYLIILQIDPSVHMAHAWSVMLVMQGAGLVLALLALPLMYRFDSNTLTVVILIIALIPILFFTFFAAIVRNPNSLLAPIRFITAHPGFVWPAIVILLLCMICASYLLSVHFCKRKYD